MRDWQLDLYIAANGLTPLALLWLLYWSMGDYK